jgi:hypothetical protein
MTRLCTICVHPQHNAINRALVRGEASNRRIAAQFRLTEQAVRRHTASHLPRRLTQAKEAEDMANSDDLLEQVSALHRRTLAILGQAEVEGEHRVALAAIREARGNLELLERLMGELHEQAQVNILVMPDYIAARTAILRALLPYPDARMAVAQALRAGAAGGAGGGMSEGGTDGDDRVG